MTVQRVYLFLTSFIISLSAMPQSSSIGRNKTTFDNGNILPALTDSASFYQSHHVLQSRFGHCLTLLDIVPPIEGAHSKDDLDFFENLCYCAQSLFIPKDNKIGYIGLFYTPPVIPVSENIEGYPLTRFNFDKIKYDFGWGDPHSGANQQDKLELMKLVHRLPEQIARDFANTPFVLTYPYDLKGRVYNHIFTRCRCYVFYNGKRIYYLYLLATTEYAERFEENVMRDFKGVFDFSSIVDPK